MEFFQTPMGKKYYQADVPRIAKALETIAEELKRSNGMKEKGLVATESIEQIADDLQQYEPNLAMILDQYRNK